MGQFETQKCSMEQFETQFLKNKIMKVESPTKVIFRKWICGYSEGSVIALFPQIPADNQGQLCLSYEHVGQHGGVNYHLVLTKTRSLVPSEYRRLYKELKQIGYRLKVYKRSCYKDQKIRRKQTLA